MRFHTFCIVAGTEACTARCSWCVASMTPDLGVGKGRSKPIDRRVFNMACRLARLSGLDTARITGKGEPTIFPDQITGYLELLKPFDFPFIELQTHGRHMADEDRVSYAEMAEWSELGLTHVCISLVSYDPERNARHYFPHKNSYFDVAALVAKLHRFGLNVRLTCIMQKGDIDCAAELHKFLAWARLIRADQVTVLPVNKPDDPGRNPAVYQAALDAMLTGEQLAEIKRYADTHGSVLRTLAWGARVYDIAGQNFCLSSCLTHTPDEDASRQLIFYPPGTIGYDWAFAGATLYRLPDEKPVEEADEPSEGADAPSDPAAGSGSRAPGKGAPALMELPVVPGDGGCSRSSQPEEPSANSDGLR